MTPRARDCGDLGSATAANTPATAAKSRSASRKALATAAKPGTATGPGRLTPAKAASPLNREWWVLWADVDLRTLVIGTPDGSFGFILNRGGPLPPDRLTAARDILDWNGYDVARLTTFR